MFSFLLCSHNKWEPSSFNGKGKAVMAGMVMSVQYVEI